MGDHSFPDDERGSVMGRLFGREPAVILGLLTALAQLLSSLFMDWTPEQQGVANVVAVSVAGFLTALAVSSEAALAALAGLVKAVIACALAFGLALDPNLQSSIMVFVSALGAFVVRALVEAPEPAA